ncbi:16S rRNA (uracil(1498)-N(3))-methyltransferase [Sulfurimonas sp.]|uniref:16S rRNA (uracil(1498)-N(3))-methyltransferase n=1 Tax=Sulfurimonas sp. TaxID=2022749 RepID=UPI002AAF1DBB|nr:16S rRNA (uracil(1498)-N(3))-methyltransferase [Sulfurimonas sp.]
MDLIYILSDEASKNSFVVKGELHKYLVKVRRHALGDRLDFRNPNEMKTLYAYEIVELDAKRVVLSLISSKEKEVKAKKSLHLAWCVIDAKSIEKVLPSLSEIGVEKISFISCERSQKNFKLDFARFKRIQEASVQQSGRSSFIEFDRYKSIKEFIGEFPDTKVFDFCEKTLTETSDFKRVLVGCEGGFSKNEREFLKTQDSFRLDTPMVIRSESAVVAVASKIIL